MVYAALNETAAGLRSTVTALHPQVLTQLGLAPGVTEPLRRRECRGEVTVDAELSDVGTPASQVLLYRAARELLANVGKHASAGVVTVRLFRSGDRIVLTVADDGAGIEPSFVAQGHIELASLEARFDAMGGAMTIESVPGLGRTVTLMSPPEA